MVSGTQLLFIIRFGPGPGLSQLSIHRGLVTLYTAKKSPWLSHIAFNWLELYIITQVSINPDNLYPILVSL